MYILFTIRDYSGGAPFMGQLHGMSRHFWLSQYSVTQSFMLQVEPASDSGLVCQPKLDLDPTWTSIKIPGDSLRLPGFAQNFWEVVAQRMQKKIENGFPNPWTCKFQVCTKILTTTHVYYSYCYIPSQLVYQCMEKVLRNFLWANAS